MTLTANREKAIKAVLIVAIATVLFLVLSSFTLPLIFPDQLLDRLVPFMQEFEGGLSRDPNDSASSNPAPWSYNGQTGWHTNKGVTYTAFVTKAPRCGYTPDAKTFFEMPDDIWMCILKEGYMSAFDLDKINHLPKIQAVIITWAWGSGVGGSTTRLSRFIRDEMNTTATTREQIIDVFNRKINRYNENHWFIRLCDRREQDFKQMPTCPTHCRGWIRRLNRFRQLFT